MPSIAVSGLAFYTGDRVPRWKGDVFVGGFENDPGPNGVESVIHPLQEGQGLFRRRADGKLMVGVGRPLPGLDDAVGKAPAADDHAQGAAEQIRVGQLLPRTGVTLVVEDLGAGLTQLLVEAVGRLPLLLSGLGERDELDLPGGDRGRPDDPALIGALLGRTELAGRFAEHLRFTDYSPAERAELVVRWWTENGWQAGEGVAAALVRADFAVPISCAASSSRNSRSKSRTRIMKLLLPL